MISMKVKTHMTMIGVYVICGTGKILKSRFIDRPTESNPNLGSGRTLFQGNKVLTEANPLLPRS